MSVGHALLALLMSSRDELVIKVLVAARMPGVDVHEVVQLHRRYVVELMQQWTRLKEDKAEFDRSGQIHVATPQLLRAFGIKASQIDPRADVVSMRPGLSGISGMQLVYGNSLGPNGPGNGPGDNLPCPKADCIANPVI